MNLLYLTINETLADTGGVSNKLFNKVNALKNEVTSCHFLNAKISFNHDLITERIISDGFLEVEIGLKSVNVGYLNKIKSDIHFYRSLATFIHQKNNEINRIICRYPFASIGLLRFTKSFYKKIVFEHNTKETEELKIEIANKTYAKFSLRPSKLFFWFQEKIHPLYCEKWVAKKIFKNAHSGACVTSEIAKYETERSPSYKTFVSSNFYNVSEVSLSISKYDNDEILKLGIIVSTTAPWYGIERLLRSFSKVQEQYILVIAGIDKNDEYLNKLLIENKIIKNVEIIGKVNRNSLHEFYNSIHVCFGSLALYKINLNYASTLKVKESVSFGVPVVIGYKEEDFESNSEFSPFYLQLKNDDSDIDFDKIKEFTRGFYSNIDNKTNLKNLALKYMDVKVKMKNLIEHIK